MAHLSMVGGIPSNAVEVVARRPGDDAARPQRTTVRPADTAEFSSRAREASRNEQGPVRQQLVEQVRRQIESGRYATPEKLDVAADRLARDLDLTA